MSLNFDEDKVNLVINGENRDDVFLLFSELKEYLSNEICIIKWTHRNLSEFYWYLPLIMIFLCMVLVIYIVQSSNVSDESLNNILQSSDINEKINYLIQTKSEDFSPYVEIILVLLPLSLFSMIFRKNIDKFISYFFPYNLFLFGKEIDRYKKRLDVRSKLFWIIFIGLILSVMGSYIVSKIH